MALGGVSPSLPLVLVVFIGLNASAGNALVAGLLTGTLLDLYPAVTPFGLLAATFGALGGAVAHVRSNVFVDSPLGHVGVTLAAALAANAVLAAGDMAAHRLFSWHYPAWALQAAAYSALVSPIVIWPLNRARRWLGIDRRARLGDV